MKQKLLAFFMVGLMLIGSALAQSRSISGKVTSQEDGLSLPGVTIQVSGTTIGTQTDVNGNYSLTVPETAKTLEFSFIGFAKQIVTIGNQTTINVSLANDAEELSEVVVTGVGVATSRKKVAIAVESVSAKDLPSAPTGSLDQALVGKIAGAQISSTSGQPGQQASILLRGINTLGSTQPMILVDGIQVNAGSNNNGSDNNSSSRLSDLDLSNVDRVEVIQGAAAGTIYGAQGANGVIQIFTKRGKRGQATAISLDVRSSFDNVVPGKLKLANNHFFNTNSEGFIIDGSGNQITRGENGNWASPAGSIDGTTLNNKPYKEQLYDHFDQLFKNNVLTQNTNLNISGGGDLSDYALTFSNLSQGSLIDGRYDRYNLSANVGTELFKNFTVRSITQLVYSDNTTGGITGANNIYSGLGTALSSPRYWDLKYKNPAGDYVADPENQNSVNPFYTQQFRDYSAKTTRIVQNLNLNYKISKFLELDYKFGIDNYRYDFEDFIKYQVNVVTPGSGLDPKSGRLVYDRDTETFKNSLLSAFIKTDFQEDFGLNIPIQTSTHLAYDWRRRDYQNVTTTGSGFAPFPPFGLDAASSKSVEEDITEFITYGYLINQRIDYGSLFGISGGVRVDYASTFGGADFKPFVFPRADAYFNFGDLIKSNKLFELKLRGAYGEAGTQPDAYDRFITLNTGNIGTGSFLGTKLTATNPNLGVQVSKEAEIGTDIGLSFAGSTWFNRVTVNATYWKRNNEDIIRALNVAPSTGAEEFLDNALTIKGEGFQLGLSTKVFSSENFNWDFGTNFGTSKSIIDKISNGKDIPIGAGGSGEFILREGEAVSTFFGKAPLSSIDQKNENGDFYLNQANAANYEIVNGIVVNKASKQVAFTSDNVRLGDPSPKFNVSFNNSFNIHKNLNINFQLDWVYGNEIYNQTKQWLFRDYLHSDFDNEVNIDGQPGAYVAYYSSLYNTNNTNGYFVEGGSFLRLRNLSASYNFTSLINKSFIKNLEFSITGRNLFTITNYSGTDPEGAAAFNDPITRGLDLYTFPNVKSVQFGIRLGL